MEKKEASNGKEGHHEHPEVDQLMEVINAEEAEPELGTVVDDLIEENGIEKEEEEEEEEVVTEVVALSSQVEEGLSETVLTQAEPVVAEDEKISNGETPDLDPSDEAVAEAVTSSSRDAEPVVAEDVKTSNGGIPGLEPSDEAVAVAEAVTSSSRDVEALPDTEETKGVHPEDNSASVAVVGSSDAVPDQSTVVTSTPIISLSQRSVQPTSWRSCCGLFDVLRRSNR